MDGDYHEKLDEWKYDTPQEKIILLVDSNPWAGNDLYQFHAKLQVD
jgi:hypothetical protein